MCYGLGFSASSYDSLVCDLGAEVKVGDVVKVDPSEFEACIHLSQVRILCCCSVPLCFFILSACV